VRILVLSSLFPYPLKSGGHVRIFNLIKGLSEKNRVSLLSLITRDEISYVRHMEKYCERVDTVPVEYNMNLRSKLRALFDPAQFTRVRGRLSMLSRGMPLTVARSYFPEFEAKLRELLDCESYDIIQVEFSHMAEYIRRNLRRIDKARIMLDEIEIGYGTLERFTSVSRGLKKIFYLQECRKMKKYEKRAWRLFDGIHTMSAVDMEKMLVAAPELNVNVIPNGVDTSYFRPPEKLTENKDIFFLGYLVHSPNVDGLSFFCRQVLPLIRREMPRARLIVAGGGEAAGIDELVGTDVIIKGYVEDVRPLMDSCRCMVVPLRVGGGTRLKILEALAEGLPVVSTAVGCEGIDVEEGKEVFIADEPESFSRQVIDLMRDDDLCLRTREAGRKLVDEKYSWESIVESLEEVYQEALKPLRA